MGFLFGGIPWYLGAFIVLVTSVDHREKAGYVACSIAVSSSLSLHCRRTTALVTHLYSSLSLIISFSFYEFFQSVVYLIAVMLGMTGDINIW